MLRRRPSLSVRVAPLVAASQAPCYLVKNHAGFFWILNTLRGRCLKTTRIKDFRGRRMRCQCFAANLNYRDGAAKDDAMYIRSKYVAFFFKFSHNISSQCLVVPIFLQVLFDALHHSREIYLPFPTYLFQECLPPDVTCFIRSKPVCKKRKVLSI